MANKNKIILRLNMEYKPNLLIGIIWFTIVFLGIFVCFSSGTDTIYYETYDEKIRYMQLLGVWKIYNGVLIKLIILAYFVFGFFLPLFIIFRNLFISKGCSLVLENNQIVGSLRFIFSVKKIQIPIEKLDNVFTSKSIADIFRGGKTVAIHSSSGVILFHYAINASEFASACVAQIEKFKIKAKGQSVLSRPVQQFSGSIKEKMNDLKELKDQGIISEEEYETKRKEILANFK